VRLLLLAALSALFWTAPATAQRPPQENMDASKMPEAGPLVTGGSGATTGPNARNQAVSPMPGATDEQLSERPVDLSVPLPNPLLKTAPRPTNR
jgi:hypothetical protein